MPYDPDRHHRRSIRLHGHDYRSPGLYFVTLCTHRRAWLFGEVHDGDMRLNVYGRVVATLWSEIPEHHPNVQLDAFQVMPNHLHGIIELLETDAPTSNAGPALAGEPGPVRRQTNAPAGSLGAIIGNVKSTAARRINALRHTPGAPLWQRNYWEHIIRNLDEYQHIATYIVSNPALWSDDQLYMPEREES